MDITIHHGGMLPGNVDDKVFGDAARKIANEVFTARVLALGLEREESAAERDELRTEVSTLRTEVAALRAEIEALKGRRER